MCHAHEQDAKVAGERGNRAIKILGASVDVEMAQAMELAHERPFIRGQRRCAQERIPVGMHQNIVKDGDGKKRCIVRQFTQNGGDFAAMLRVRFTTATHDPREVLDRIGACLCHLCLSLSRKAASHRGRAGGEHSERIMENGKWIIENGK
jgi:hypothetical protein